MSALFSIAKAIVAFLVAFLTPLYTMSDHGLTAKEWIASLLIGLGSGFLVYITPNSRTTTNP